MAYTPTAPLPDFKGNDDTTNMAAFTAAGIISHYIPGLVRNDADQDTLEAKIRDVIYDVATGKVTCYDVGQDDHYDENGNCE
jgi:hypothetical protein